MRTCLALILIASTAFAEGATPEETKNLEAMLAKLLLTNLPSPMIESKDNWNHQKEEIIGLKWERDGLRLKPVPMKGMRNDGFWQKARADAIEPARSLSLKITNVLFPEPGRSSFTAAVGLDNRIVYESQMWTLGKRIYAGETRCRCRSDLLLNIELTNKLETKPGELLPALAFRIKVTKADLNYRDLVVEHTLGLDGKPAENVGKVAVEFVKKVKPDLERQLLDKANAAIVKAADTKEIRVEMDHLLKGKLPEIKREK